MFLFHSVALRGHLVIPSGGPSMPEPCSEVVGETHTHSGTLP